MRGPLPAAGGCSCGARCGGAQRPTRAVFGALPRALWRARQRCVVLTAYRALRRPRGPRQRQLHGVGLCLFVESAFERCARPSRATPGGCGARAFAFARAARAPCACVAACARAGARRDRHRIFVGSDRVNPNTTCLAAGVPQCHVCISGGLTR